VLLFFITGSSFAEYAPVYSADLTSANVVNDFTYSQVGTIGIATGAHASVTFTNNSLRLAGRYTSIPGLRLKNIYVTNSLRMNFSFRLQNTATSETAVALGWRMRTNATANTYPLYYLSLGRNATNASMCSIQLIKKWEYSGSTGQKVLGKYDYTPSSLINTSAFNWCITSEIIGTNQFGDKLAISAYVTNNGIPFCSFNITDTAIAASGSNATPSKPVYGGIGIAAGSLDNNSKYVGMDVLELSVSENPVRPIITPEFSIAGIGNSFTYYWGLYPIQLYDIAAVGYHAITPYTNAIAGSTLKKHCTETNTLEWVATNRFDYYVINELSTDSANQGILFNLSWRTNEFPFYADKFITTIQSNHPASKIILYEAWAAKTNILDTAGVYAQPALTALFTDFAARYTNVEVVPFGRAMQRAHQQCANPNPPLLSGDASEHPASAGSYFLACVLYSHLFDESPEGFPYYANSQIIFTNYNYASFLQRIAYDTHMHTVFTNPPQVTVTGPATPSTSTASSFSVSAADNGTITNYYWSFGDGTFTNGANLTSVTHQYTATGSYDANVTVQDDSGEWERIGQWITVNSKSNQTINFPAISTQIATNTVTLSATAGSGLPISFTVYSGPGSISGSTNLMFTGAGQVSIVASQSGDGIWNAAPNVTNSFTVHGIPAAGPVTLQRVTNQLLKVTTTMLLANTTDPEGSTLSVVWVSPVSTNGGSITLSGRWVTYTPPEGSVTDDFFQFRVRNAFGGEAVGVAKIETSSPSSTGSPTLNFNTTPVAGNVELKIFGIPGRTYIVQGATRLIGPDWVNLRECTIGAGGYVYFTETNPPSPRYYRTAQP
jgi:hypothetical protein